MDVNVEESRHGVIVSPEHPWNAFSGERIWTMVTSFGTGYKVRLDNGIETFVLSHEWKSA